MQALVSQQRPDKRISSKANLEFELIRLLLVSVGVGGQQRRVDEVLHHRMLAQHLGLVHLHHPRIDLKDETTRHRQQTS